MAAPITSAWSTVHDALVALVQAAAPTSTRVFGWTPHPDDLGGGGTWAWVPDSDPGSDGAAQAYEVSSLTAKVETWEQDIVVLGIVLTSSGKDARDRVDAVAMPVLAAVSADPSLGGLVELAEVVNTRREAAAPTRTERHHALTIRVRVRAHLTS